MATTYKEMKQELRNKQSFTGNSVTARYNSFGYYIVESYATTIFEDRGDNKYYFDNSYYSTTTSKLQNMLIDIFSLNDGKKKRD